MTPHSMSSTDSVEPSSSSQLWGNEIWFEEVSWFTLAQLLWVKLSGSPMSYGQLHYIVSAPLLPVSSRRDPSGYRKGLPAPVERSGIYEMELVMDPARGILLLGEVYGKPGDHAWQPERVYERLLECSAVLTEFFQYELLGDHSTLFSPGHVLILRDGDRSQLAASSLPKGVSIITHDELSTIQHHLHHVLDEHVQQADVPFGSYGHVVISALRNISNNSRGEIGGFRSADEIYDVPRLPAWLR